MDTSETYIKMCDCEEIRKWCNPHAGDIILRRPPRDVPPFYLPRDITYHSRLTVCTSPDQRLRDGDIWLPRQDQLQAMLYGKMGGTGLILLVTLLNRLGEEGECENCIDTNYIDLSSMEQLWMAFVMKENHNKVWDNNEWRVG